MHKKKKKSGNEKVGIGEPVVLPQGWKEGKYLHEGGVFLVFL